MACVQIDTKGITVVAVTLPSDPFYLARPETGAAPLGDLHAASCTRGRIGASWRDRNWHHCPDTIRLGS
eukprot:5434231-Amphidinium_carterae.1